MNFFWRVLIATVNVFVVGYITPGITVPSIWVALVVAVVLSFLNAIVRPILLILTLPVTVFTLGLFLFVINAVIILMASKLVNGFQVDGFWPALLFSLILSLLNAFVNAKALEAKK